MEKYYFGSLNENPLASDAPMKSKLVELNFERRPPSFGVVYLVDSHDGPSSSSSLDTLISNIKHNKRKPPKPRHFSHINLKALELSDQSEAKFKPIKQIDLRPLRRRIVDFDVDQVICMDPVGSAKCSQQNIRGCLLDELGGLYSLALIDGSVKCLLNDQPPAVQSAGKALHCKLLANGGHRQSSAAGANNAASIVHVLHEKCYFSYAVKMSPSQPAPTPPADQQATLQLIGSCSVSKLPIDRSLRFTQLLAARGGELAIIELSDLSIQIVHKFRGLSTLSLNTESGDDNHAHELRPPKKLTRCTHLDLSCGFALNEPILLLSNTGSRIVAHSVAIPSDEDAGRQTEDRDPDQLLPREPSFELEKRWTFELGEVGNIRYLIESEEEEQRQPMAGSMCPIWSPKQQASLANNWPKFLLVPFRFHLLVLSFEQEPVQPFSVIYDRAFLKVTTMSTDADASGQQTNIKEQDDDDDGREFIDAKARPKLVHNFKLIGPKPSDCLFNTLFLAKPNADASFVQFCHFPLMGLLVGQLNTNELLVFKLISETIFGGQKDSLYQKLVRESIAGSSSVLRDQIIKLATANRSIQNQANSLENKPLSRIIDDDSSNIFRLELNPDDQRASPLYSLFIRFACPELIDEIIVSVSVEAHILEPLAATAFRSVDIMNSDDPTDKQKSMAFMSLDRSTNRSDEIELPIVIADYQTGSIEVIVTTTSVNLEPAHDASNSDDLIEEQQQQQQHVPGFYLDSLPVKPLQSYRATTYWPTDEALDSVESLEIRGDFAADRIELWLSDCFNSFTFDRAANLQSRFESLLAGRFLQFKLGDNSLLATSNDLIALDLIRKTIMRRATEESIKLDMSHWNLSAPILPPTSRIYFAPKVDSNENSNLESSLVLDTIMSEISAHQDECDDWMKDALGREIQLAMKRSEAFR